MPERMELVELCGATVPVTNLAGQVRVAETPEAMQIVEYSASVSYEGQIRIVYVYTKGAEAVSRAAAIFDSLECQ
ncbi:hypothetical protein [Rubidibacter lacunae]|nr:hypothetical protein [Rubidibacter lacunae]